MRVVLHPCTRSSRLALALIVALAAAAPGRGGAFALLDERIVGDGLGGVDVPATLELASRWDAFGPMADGIQVGVEVGFATDLGAADANGVALIQQAVASAFAAWETPFLRFDITFEDPGTVRGSGAGREIDVFAVPNSDPVWPTSQLFGFTLVSEANVASRALTNGQSGPGFVILGGDLFINIDNTNSLAALLGMTQTEKLQALQRLVMHEAGHQIGLGHPNGNIPPLQVNFDDDLDPLNAMNLDPLDPFSTLAPSPNRNDQAIMSNRPCGVLPSKCPALFFGVIQNDDRGGLEALYPAVDTDSDGVADDGDLSGTSGDLPCGTGASLGCDDNCRVSPNPGQDDHGGVGTSVADGIGDACQCGDNSGDGIVNVTDRVILARALGGAAPGDRQPVSGLRRTVAEGGEDRDRPS
ncbi:MAG: hypothetical protein ACE5IL_13350 [Myxococcota bacterium]